jgi:flagellar protein FliJ
MSLSTDFRLQPVLNYKSQMVDALEMEFARLKLAYQQEQALLTSLQQAAEHEMDALHERQAGQLDCSEIQLRQDYLHSLQHTVVQQNGRVEEAEQRMGCKREELVETMQDQKALEKLREHHQAQVHKEMDRRESLAVDDMVTGRFVHAGGRHA